MSELEIPIWKRAVGSAAGWCAFIAVGAFARMPTTVAYALIVAAEAIVKLAGASAGTRLLADLRLIVRRGGAGVDVVRKLGQDGRADQIVGIVRGAVIRSLP